MSMQFMTLDGKSNPPYNKTPRPYGFEFIDRTFFYRLRPDLVVIMTLPDRGETQQCPVRMLRDALCKELHFAADAIILTAYWLGGVPVKGLDEWRQYDDINVEAKASQSSQPHPNSCTRANIDHKN